MDEQFEHLTQTGAGWLQARLTLSGEKALIEYDSSCMGMTPLCYLLHCEHKKFSDFHGGLITTSIEQYKTHQNQFGGHVVTDVKETINMGRLIDPDADGEMLEILNSLHLEYIRLPEPQLRLEEPGGNWGIHDWTNTFSLILMIHFAGYWNELSEHFEETQLGRGLAELDKMHMAVAKGKYSLRR